ncbi:hypothetical protein FKG94_21095 [Exilibacterium tricleocarpae]|uniref:Membrane protein YkvI n=1 Tax=Exilibacterium tricleocarpae TaxID=2591008 RepID=A0A545T060_9GAMM|nr:hypothetical protein [Exilibacterium tricleocarpae]TQV70602.1 hypothetical protein FKG94_21095 [Exilibacterium tricleocarpae]
MLPFFRKYLLPGFIFQSVVIGGGYATGRELVEFFFAAGPLGGVLGLLVSGLVFGVVMALGFEMARVTRSYDYRSFCRQLLGRGWFVFEVAYLLQLLLVLSVISSAAGRLTAASFGVPAIAGTLGLIGLIGLLTFAGSALIKRVLAGWSVLLYGVYLLLFIFTVQHFGGDIVEAYKQPLKNADWLGSGILYSGYNLAVLPAVLFAVSTHTTRRETLGAGLIAGAIAVIPAVLFFVTMMAHYPDIGAAPVPASVLMAELGIGWLALIFQVVVFGTFVETGTAMLHAVNQRLDTAFHERNRRLPRFARPLVSLGFLGLAIYAAQTIGIVDLIARGYGVLTLVFIAVLILPLVTVGIWKILHHR